MRFFSLIFFCLVALDTYSQSVITTDSAAIQEVDSLIALSNELRYDETDSSRVIAEIALQRATEIEYQMGIANSYNSLGIAFDLLGVFGKSFSFHKKAIDLYISLGNGRGVANSQANMAILLKQDKKYEEALTYLTESNKYFLSVQDTFRSSTSLMTIGNLMLDLGRDLPLVLEKHRQAEAGLRAIKDTANISATLNAQAHAYARHEMFVESIPYYKQAIFLAEKADKPWILGYAYTGISRAYLGLNQLDLAEQSNIKGLENHRKTGHLFGVMELMEVAVSIKEKQGDLTEALANLRQFQVYKDSLYNEKQSKQLNQVRTEYETEKKETEINTLSQQASIQALEIKQKNQAIIIGLVVILFVLAAVYFIYKQRETKKQQSQTELEQRFLRSQLNPHFISNALVAVQSFMLKNDSESAALYLTKFSKLMREILENSRKEFIPVDEEINMLKNYLDIHKLRLGSFDYSIEIDENIDPEMDTMPPMFVQPFVENAVEHGIASVQEGKINLKFKKEGDYISIVLNDNGKGLSSNKNEDHTSLSSTIIQERMNLFNRSLKKKIQMAIDNLKNENGETLGTKVELKVPYGSN